MLIYKWTDELEVIGYSDSDFAGCIDSSKSTLGYFFMFVGEAVSWRSTKQILTVTFTIEAKFVSYFEATSHVVWLKSFIVGRRFIVIIQLLYLWLRIIRVIVELSTSTLSI